MDRNISSCEASWVCNECFFVYKFISVVCTQVRGDSSFHLPGLTYRQPQDVLQVHEARVTEHMGDGTTRQSI